jgi:hypothetical protein
MRSLACDESAVYGFLFDLEEASQPETNIPGTDLKEVLLNHVDNRFRIGCIVDGQ